MDTTPAQRTLDLWRVPKRYQASSWDYLSTDWQYVREYRAALAKGISVYLYGEYGFGKSCLAALALINAYESKRAGFWCNAFDLAGDRLSDEEVDGLRLWDRIVKSPVLVVDDLFVSKDVKFNDTTIERLIRSRVENQLLTVVSSNVEPRALESLYPALVRGMDGTYAWVKVDGKNFRREGLDG